MNEKFELTVFRKSDGLLSKQISLANGEIKRDGTACRMARGTAQRMKFDSVDRLAELIDGMQSNEALTLGRLRADLPDSVEVILKHELNGGTPPHIIARTGDCLHFAEHAPALMLLDHDGKETPNEVADKLNQIGGFWSAIIAIAPQLAGATRVTRCSTSAGLYDTSTGERFAGSNNVHIYVGVTDGSDIERALKTLHQRLWLAGLGYFTIGAAGTLLDRSIVDASVYGAERLVFEGAPIVEPPLAQDAAVRQPQAYDGQVIDTVRAIPALSEEEACRLAALKAEAARQLKPAAAAARKAWAEDFARKRGLTQADAERIATAAGDKHVLAPEFELEFDELGSCTVADVLADPDRYVNERLADPLEGIDYGRGKAKVLKRYDGTLMINSYAHGGCKYQLEGQGVGLDDFNSFMEKASTYIYAPTRAMWPGSRVNARVPPVPLVDHNGEPLLDDKGKPKSIPATAWLDHRRPIEQLTWAPGRPLVIEGWLIAEGGWISRPGVRCFNLYRPPRLELGDAAQAEPWLELVHKVYPADAAHLIGWFAQRVQHPEQKLNHALVLGGKPGIGKDTIIEPVKRAVGPWNFAEVSPQEMLGTFTHFRRSVILRISEARDLGDSDRFKFYDHSKTLIAAPPDVLQVNEKFIKEYYVPNVVGVIITTNHKTDGIYLPNDDRRHYVAWSELSEDDFGDERQRKRFWDEIWRWYDEGGINHVAAYLSELDLSTFNAKAPPPKTAAFWAIADAGAAPENAELADVFDELGNPDAVTLEQIQENATGDFFTWIVDRRNRRAIPHRLDASGYVAVRNKNRRDGLWKINGKRQVIYAKATLSLQDQLNAANELICRFGADNQEETAAE